ncbi:hypothetical protein JNUCC83_01565 [Vagococcus sp. JNUCC 83]
MKTKEEKEMNIIDDIVKTVKKMDEHLEVIQQEDITNQTKLKEWFYEKEMLHDIRHILHDIDKYDGYNLKRVDPIDENLKELGLDAQTASFMRDYFC